MAASASARLTATDLPAPYADWNVRVRGSDGAPGRLDVSYDSPLLDRRVHNTVFLPTSYSRTGKPAPVMYFLHGTVLSYLDFRTDGQDGTPLPDGEIPLSGFGSAREQLALFDFAEQRGRMNFLVVAPDTGPNDTWCETCLWIDGRADWMPNLPPLTAETVPAESHLHRELIPLVEELFNVRDERSGRGVFGFSMGGAGALIQGMRHPGRFAYVGSLSGAYDLLAPGVRVIGEVVGYLRDQGYGTSLLQERRWRNVNPADLAGNLAGANVELMLSAGNGVPRLHGGRSLSPITPGLALLERALRHNTDLSVDALDKRGVDARQVRMPGVHGGNNEQVFDRVIVPDANRTFANPTPPEPTFAYRTADESFTVHGYRVTARRDGVAFTRLSEARRDGRTFRITGTGRAHVTTPATFEPATSYRVHVDRPDSPPTTHPTKPGEDGRITLDVDLHADTATTVRIAPTV